MISSMEGGGGIMAALDGASSSRRDDNYFEPKHSVFLSHSGAQKSFVKQLCMDIEEHDRSPFFDQCRDSLPIGCDFPSSIFEAIEQCQVAVVVLSEEFFSRTKWPMLELAALVKRKAHDLSLTIMPVFLGMTHAQCQDKGNHDRWLTLWRSWAEQDNRIIVEDWKAVFKVFGPTNGISLTRLDEVKCRQEIVDAICREVPPNTRWDDSHVQGRSRLYEEIQGKINPGHWLGKLKGIDPFKQYQENDDMHPIFPILGRSFKSLNEEDQSLFLDAAIFSPNGKFWIPINLFTWLSMVHGKSIDIIKTRLEGLKRKSLIGDLGDGSKAIGMHDLWREFAVKEARGREFGSDPWFYRKVYKLNDPRREEYCLSGGGWKSLQRVCFVGDGYYPYGDCIVKELDLKCCSNLRVLKLVDVSLEMEVLDVSSLQDLKSLEVDLNSRSVQISGLGCLTNLVYLRWDSKQRDLPYKEIEGLTSLNALELRGSMGRVQKLPDLSRLNLLQDATLCAFGKADTISGLSSRMTNLKRLDLSWCEMLRSCNGVGELLALEELELSCCYALEELPNLGRLKNLLKLNIYSCKSIEAVPGLSDLVSLQLFEASYCARLAKLPDMHKLVNLQELDLRRCLCIQTIPGSSDLIGLKTLEADCRVIQGISDLRKLTKLEDLQIEEWSAQGCLPCLSDLVNLKRLEIDGSAGVDEFTGLLNLRCNLQDLYIIGCSFKDVQFWSNTLTLTSLGIYDCDQLERLRGLDKLTGLEELTITRCKSLRDWNSGSGLRLFGADLNTSATFLQLHTLDLSGVSFTELPDLSSFPQLSFLQLYECGELTSLTSSAPSTALETLKLNDCRNLRTLPDLSKLVSLRDFSLEDCGVQLTQHEIETMNALCPGLKLKSDDLPVFLGKEREKSYKPHSLFELKGSSAILLESPWTYEERKQIQENSDPSFELDGHQGDVILQIQDRGLANMESEVQVPIPGDCYDFGEHDDVSICELMHEEIMKIGNISEASLKDLEGEEIIVLCNYIAKDDLLEFYFKHGKDMASVAGVGLDYAKVLLIEGWKVKVEEILEEDWVQAWKKVVSSSTTMPKLLRVESDALMRSKKEVFIGKEILKPLLWDLAKYFTLNESIDSLVKSTTTSSSHGQNSRGSTSDGSSSNPQGSYGNDNRGGFQEALPKWFNSQKKQGGNNGEDNNDDEGNDNKGKAPDPSPSDGDDNDLKWSKVFVDLLPGGDVLEESKFSLTERKKLKTLNGTISPHLEFNFQKKSENKEIEVIVGNVQFNLGFAKHGGSDQVKWIHDDMGISFGLQGDADNQVLGELVRNSFKHFDIVNTRKETMTESHTNEKRKGKDYNVEAGLYVKPHGVGLKVNTGGKHSKVDANSQQHERSSETSCAILEGGMKFRQIRDSNDERQIRCEYFFPREKDNTINLSTSPMSFIQDVRFQATWRPLDVKPKGISRDFVVYTLEVDRNLEEIVGETTNSEEFVEVNVNTSEAEIPQHGGPIKYIRKLINRGRKTNAAQKASTSESDTSQHGGPVKCKQIYKKSLYINHAMTNLDSKTHELKEVKENSDKFQYFCPVKNRKFYDNGSPKPYVWVNGALVKLEEDSEPSSVATTSATPTLSVRNPRNKDVASTSATPALLVRNPQNKDVASTSTTSCVSLTCDNCKQPTKQRRRCLRCKSMNYCTRDCQVKHWSVGHKSECRPVDANASRGAM